MFSNKYQTILDIFEKNKETDWENWLTFDKCLEKGKQGVVGLFNIKDTDEPLQLVFKFSQNMSFLAKHEKVIMKGLDDISQFVPCFCRCFGIIKCKVEPDRKSKVPFTIVSKYPIEKNVLLLEYIDKSYKFYDYIKSKKISEDVLYSLMKQVLMSINIAQKIKKFTHYDLHSNNIMVKKCNKDVVFLYKLDEDNQFVVPSYGYFPKIIDFGFSYIEDMEDGPLWTSLCHSNAGFMSDRFDWVSDPKLFLMTVSDEIKNKRASSKSKKLRRIVRNMFHPLKVDLRAGWDEYTEKAAVDYVADMIHTYETKSKIFEDCDYYCLDILQSLIILPLQQAEYKNTPKNYKTFISEWIKIEKEISNEFFNLFILKEIVNIARNVRADYLSDDEIDKKMAVSTFKDGLYESLNKISKFCDPKKLNIEILLCSLLALAENIEGILFDIMTAQVAEKEKDYKKLPVNNLEQIYAVIDVNLPDDYVYNKNTKFYIIDVVNKNNDLFNIPLDEIENINKIHNIARGTYVYDLYKNL